VKYIDTDVFVYWATDHPEHGRRATEILRHIELNEKAVSSALSLWLFNKAMRNAQGYSLPAFLDQVTRMRNLKFVGLDADSMREAAEAAKRFNVPEEVAVAYGVAKDRGADAVYSTNPEFDRTDLKRIF
jgi:predicted nucleic acid-binding protein